MTDAWEKRKRGQRWDAAVEDALKRQKGKPSGLKIQPPAPRKRRLWPWLALATVMLVGVTVLVLISRPARPEPVFREDPGATDVDAVQLLSKPGDYMGRTVRVQAWSGRDPYLMRQGMVEPVGYHVFSAEPGMMTEDQGPGRGYFYLKVTQAQEDALKQLEKTSRWLWITLDVEKAEATFADPRDPEARYYCIGALRNATLERRTGQPASRTR